MAEDEIMGWHHQLNGCESEQIQETVTVRRAWHGVQGGHRVEHNLVTEQQQLGLSFKV